MKLPQILLTVLLSFVVAFSTAYFLNTKNTGNTAAVHETRLDQIKRTGTLRCGYTVWPPFLTKDPNTGQMDGPFYELMEKIGKELNLKVEWAAEVSMGQMFSDMALNRYDMVCGPFFATPGRAREGDFTMPVFYAPANIYVRGDDTRFDNNYDAVNQPDVKLATLDGEFTAIAAAQYFPKAQKVAVTQLSSGADLYMLVMTKKADAVIDDAYTFADFNATHPGALRAAAGKPLQVTSVALPIPANEPALKDMLDTTLAYLHDSGFIDQTLDKYEGVTKSMRLAKPYRE